MKAEMAFFGGKKEFMIEAYRGIAFKL